MSGKKESTPDAAQRERWNAIFAKIQDDIGPPPTPAERLRRFTPASQYPQFVDQLLVQFPEREFVFFERDALPIMWTMEVLRGGSAGLHRVYLNTKMMPEKCRREWPKPAPTVAEDFTVRSKHLRTYAAKVRRGDSRLMRYLRQELDAVPVGAVLVDTGFWGSMPTFVQALFPKKKFEMFWFVGPPGAPSWLTESGAEQSAQTVEHAFRWPYDAETGILDDDGTGRLHPRIRELEHERAVFAEQKQAVIDMAREHAARNAGATAT